MPPPRRSLKKLAKIVEQEVLRQEQLGRQLRLMFQDEARFGRINDPRRCWAPKGVRPEVGMQIAWEYTYAFGAVSPKDDNLDSLVLPVVTAEAMSIFLEEVARRHPEEFILMFLDGAGWHRANDLAVPENMRLEALPPWEPPAPGRGRGSGGGDADQRALPPECGWGAGEKDSGLAGLQHHQGRIGRVRPGREIEDQVAGEALGIITQQGVIPLDQVFV